MGDVEYRGLRVVVDCDDFLALVHTRLVLDCAADSDCDIKRRSDGGSGLADLVVVVDEAEVNGGPCRGGRGAEAVGQVPDEPEVFLAAHACAAGDDEPGGLEVNFFGPGVLFENFEGEVRSETAGPFQSMILPFLEESGAGIGITPSRTVAIWGQRS